MNTDFWIEQNKQNILNDLQQLIKIRSVEDHFSIGENAPFGEGVRACLDKALEIGRRLGFRTKDLDGYCGIIEAGEGDELMGILCHLDVVPEGTGWIFDPYEAQIEDGKMYGRGTLDDKGPAIAAIYALKSVVESGIKLNKRVRIILGCNEETNMQCLKYYKAHEEIPSFSISPDACFPVTNCEMSILKASFEKKYDSRIVMKAGEAPNIVPAIANAKVDRKEFSATGIQAHASMPWEGENAILKLLTILDEQKLGGEDEKVVSVLHNAFKEQYYGEGFGLEYQDDSGRLTLNLGLCDWNENGFRMTLDLRCPITLPEEKIKEKLCSVFNQIDAKLVDWKYKPGFAIADDDPMVLKLLGIYVARTGETDAKPLHIGGGTYARELPNAVSFGPEGYLCTSSCHVANEHIGIDQLLFNTKLIADAILSVTRDGSA